MKDKHVFHTDYQNYGIYISNVSTDGGLCTVK